MTPAPSWPPTIGYRDGMSPVRTWSSEWHRPDAVNLIRTSPALGASRSRSTMSQGLPASHMTAARVFTVALPGAGPRTSFGKNLTLVAFEDQPQPDECEVRLVFRDRLGLVDDERGETACRHDHRFGLELGGDPSYEAVDLPGEAVDDARLQRLDRRLPDDGARPDELNLEQSRGASRECVDGDLDSWGERTTEELAAFAHDVEVGRGAEVDDDRRPAEDVMRGERVDDPVGTNLARVVVEDRDAGLDPRLDDDGGNVCVVTVEDAPQFMQHSRNGRARSDTRRCWLVLQEPAEQQRDLVGGCASVGLDAPRLDKLLPLEAADHRVGVADIDGQQHPSTPFIRASSGRRRCRGRSPNESEHRRTDSRRRSRRRHE